MNKNKRDEVLKAFCEYYASHYETFEEELQSLGIRELEYINVEKPTVYIKLDRPGKLIGSKGSNIEELTDHLRTALSQDSLRIYILESTTPTVTQEILYWSPVEEYDYE